MVNATHRSFAADDRSYFSIIKKEIHKLAQECGIPEVRINEIDIIVSELTSNLSKHTVGGEEILAGIGQDEQGPYIEIISIDNGPGVRDVEKVMADGYSSASTLGHGLGSIKRLSDTFDIYSQSGWGTIVLSRVYKEPSAPFIPKSSIICKAVVVAKPGETLSGDGFFFQSTDEGFKIMIADGLGHGPSANHAVNEAVKAFTECTETSAVEIIRYIHKAIKKTRGIVAHIVLYNTTTRSWCGAGVGNIATKWIGGLKTKAQISYNGIIGHNIPTTINDLCLKQEEYQQFISCSDGIRSRWDPTKLAFINRHDSTIQAAAIYKEYARRTDDMSVVICKVI
jgi:anti-sigma regulatory factor (Ser/Thr protein kinase)